jgi:hypothetical protein
MADNAEDEPVISLDEIKALALEAYRASAGQAYEITIASRSGGDVRAMTQLWVALTPEVVVALAEAAQMAQEYVAKENANG